MIHLNLVGTIFCVNAIMIPVKTCGQHFLFQYRFEVGKFRTLTQIKVIPNPKAYYMALRNDTCEFQDYENHKNLIISADFKVMKDDSDSLKHHSKCKK